MDKLLNIVGEWLDGTAKEQACGYGPNGPNVQVQRPNGETTLIDLRSVSKAWLKRNKDTSHE